MLSIYLKFSGIISIANKLKDFFRKHKRKFGEIKLIIVKLTKWKI